MSHVTCHVSHDIFHVSFVIIYLILLQVAEVFVGGSTGPTPFSYFLGRKERKPLVLNFTVDAQNEIPRYFKGIFVNFSTDPV